MDSFLRFALGLTLSIPLAGCASGFLGSIDTVEALREACDEHEPVDMEFDVFFEETPGGCPWGEDGNWEQTSGVVSARREQTAVLEVPEGGIVCGLGFDFQGVDPSFEQVMEYDDHFLLNFNDTVLAASYGAMVDRFEEDDGLRAYDWEALQGFEVDLHGDIPPYCVGEQEGLSDCTIPESETPGTISLSFGGGLVDRMSFDALVDRRYAFQFVTTGDDNDTDCSHEDFQFTVTAPVVTQ